MTSKDADPGSEKKGQRYYLFEKELSRPQPQFQPRGRPRVPFSQHEYFGIYPTKGETDTNRFFVPYRPVRDSRYYTRPPDEYHGHRDDERSSRRHSSRERRHSSDRRSRSSHDYHRSRDRYHDDDRGHRVLRNPEYHEDDRRYRDHDHRRGSSMDRDRDRRRESSIDRDRDRGRGSSMDRHRGKSRTRSRSRSPHEGPRGDSDERRKDRHRIPPVEEYSKETDLSVEIHPLMHFIEDKPKLLSEAMSILRGKKLEALIPPELKKFSHARLEYLCLKELKSVSLATIANVIDGKIINVDQTMQSKPEKKDGTKSSKKVAGSKRKTKDGASIPLKKIKKKLKKSIKESKDNEPSPKKKKKRKAEKTAATVPTKKSKVSSKSKAKDKKIKDKAKKKKKAKEAAAEESAAAASGLPPQKTLMELLELEYRAKAIKALLKTQGLDMSKIDDALSLDTSPPHQDPSVDIASSKSPNPEHDPVQRNNSIPDTDLPNSAPPPAVEPEDTAVRIPNVPAASASPDSTVVVNESSARTPVLSKPESNTPAQVTSSLTPEQNQVAGEFSSEEEEIEEPPVHEPENQSKVAIDEEELDYECEVEIEEVEDEDDFVVVPPVPDSEPEEIQEKEEGEIGSEDEAEEPEDPEPEPEPPAPFSCFRKDNEKGRYTDSSSSSDEDDVGGWRVHNSDDESRPRRRRRWVKDPTPEAVYKRDTADFGDLSDISNQELPEIDKDKDKPVSPKPNANDDSDTDGGFYPEPRSPTPTDADGNKIQCSSDESSDDENDKDQDQDNITVITEQVHTCEEKPEDYNEEENQNQERSGDGYDEDEEEDTPITWFNRWYNSKKVQKNVKSSKLIGRLRSKLRREKPLPDLPPDPSKSKEADPEVPIVGSIQEYEKLFGSGKYKPLPPPPEPEPEPVEPEVESEEDEDDDALWGDIIGAAGSK